MPGVCFEAHLLLETSDRFDKLENKKTARHIHESLN